MTSPYEEIANLLVERGDCVALTGAGISAESGIPTFRSKGGFWEKFDWIFPVFSFIIFR